MRIAKRMLSSIPIIKDLLSIMPLSALLFIIGGTLFVTFVAIYAID